MGRAIKYPTEQIGTGTDFLVDAKEQQESSHRRECRQAIIDYALSLVNGSERPEGVSAAMLVAKIGLPRHLFQRLFDGIDDFQDALIGEGWRLFMRQLRLAVADVGGRDGLNRLTRAYRQFVKTSAGTYYVALCQGRETLVGRQYVARLDRLLYTVLASCDLDQTDLQHTARNLADVLHGLAVIEITGDSLEEINETIAKILKTYIDDLFDSADE